jgi:arginine utilization regulatory protein
MPELINGEENSKIIYEVLNNLREGVNIVNAEGILTYSNNMSGEYVNCLSKDMIGHHISEFYPQAALINVLKTGKQVNIDKVRHNNGKIYKVHAYPIFSKGSLIGGYAVFTDITEVTRLNDKLEELELRNSISKAEDIFTSIVGWDGSLKDTISKAKKSVGSLGGPRHSIIIGESGTGKTMLARSIYQYAKEIGVIKSDAPFVEVNCAQYTNADIAAMEVFGCNEGSYTGAKDKKGLFEIADGGILFLDEAHTLNNYQNLLLKVLESGHVRRIGDIKDRKINVIVIAASTRNLHNVFVPELYQRLAQYELFLCPLKDRTSVERQSLMSTFVKKYEMEAKERYGINLKIEFDEQVQSLLINYNYPRNIRQFRDVINSSIDSAVPLINPGIVKTTILTRVKMEDVQAELKETDYNQKPDNNVFEDVSVKEVINDRTAVDNLIIELSDNGYGPRKIANILNKKGIDIKYYQVAYKLNKIKNND